MPEAQSKTRLAWQPLTFGGVAAFAGTPLRRLFLVQFMFAAIVAVVVVWFVDTNWYPVIQRAISQLPDSGEILDGKLDWPEQAPQLLADDRYVAVGVDLKHSGEIRSPAHLQIELGRSTMRFFSLFGYVDFVYPQTGWIIACNRVELEPWWGAWSTPVLGITFALVIILLLAAWAMLASVFFLPVWLIGYFANRHLSFQACWKLTGAALLPGAILMVAAILFYGIGFLDLVQLMAAGVAHLVVDLVYVLFAPVFAPELFSSEFTRGNPFTKSQNKDPANERGK